MSEADQAFYHRPAEEELQDAQRSSEEWLVSDHYRLAGFHLDLVFGDQAFNVVRPSAT